MLNELYQGLGCILIYFVLCASGALLLRVFTKIEDETFRKTLHYILLGSLLVWVNVYETWWIASLACVGFVVAVYPILYLMEKVKGYSQFVTERKTGELKSSLVQVFGMFALVIAVCWGIFGDKYLVLASVYAWGFGDAAAALIGKKFGKHKINHKMLDGKKSYEGTFAMYAVSFISVFAILVARGGLDWFAYLVISLITAAVSATTELFSKNGIDTVTCPLESMATLLILLHLFGGI